MVTLVQFLTYPIRITFATLLAAYYWTLAKSGTFVLDRFQKSTAFCDELVIPCTAALWTLIFMGLFI